MVELTDTYPSMDSVFRWARVPTQLEYNIYYSQVGRAGQFLPAKVHRPGLGEKATLGIS